ncbi:MAG: 50S ribosomal protein L22 [Fimbriimonadaceae bacterium]|nr:50S ribosomal protein L22 [Fimbriimonadaceae bacterium]
MEVKAVAKYVRVQPRKVRIIADKVRGKDAGYTAALLRYHPSKGAKALRKVLISAMANAQENHGLSLEALKISTIMVDEGPRLKRLQARAMGRGNRIVKKTSHITVVVEEAEPQARVKAHGTQAKPRPKLADGKRPKKPASASAKATADESPQVEEMPVEAVAEAPVEAPVEKTPAEAPVEAEPGEEAKTHNEADPSAEAEAEAEAEAQAETKADPSAEAEAEGEAKAEDDKKGAE